MAAYAECAFAKKNGRTIFAVLDHQRLRSQSQHLLRGSRQVRLPTQRFGFGIVDQQHIHHLQGFEQFLARAVDPVIHGVAAGQAHAFHIPSHRRLQIRMNIGQKQKL